MKKQGNNVRLNSAVGYVTPKDTLGGRQQEIHNERDRKLEEARKGARRAGRTPLEEGRVPVRSRR
jgi:phage portal protein BeeE